MPRAVLEKAALVLHARFLLCRGVRRVVVVPYVWCCCIKEPLNLDGGFLVRKQRRRPRGRLG